MSDLNSCSFTGRLTREPEMRAVGEKSVAKFGLAVGRTYKKDGQKVEEVAFIDCEAWGPLAEVIQAHSGKGHQVAVHGRLKLDTWEKDGQKQSKLKLIVGDLTLLARPAAQDGAQPAPAAPRPAAARPAAAAAAAYDDESPPF